MDDFGTAIGVLLALLAAATFAAMIWAAQQVDGRPHRYPRLQRTPKGTVRRWRAR